MRFRPSAVKRRATNALFTFQIYSVRDTVFPNKAAVFLFYNSAPTPLQPATTSVCWELHFRLTSSLDRHVSIVSVSSFYWLRQLLLATPASTGFASFYWLRQLLLALPASTGFASFYWLRQLLLASPASTGYASFYWLRQLLLATPASTFSAFIPNGIGGHTRPRTRSVTLRLLQRYPRRS